MKRTDDRQGSDKPDDGKKDAAPETKLPTHVVGVGASAGGLEALEALFDGVPSDTGLAFVVVQHLSPDFKSMMDELLGRHTSMKIHRVEDGMRVAPNCVYLIPPKKEMIISGGRLLLTDKDPDEGLSLPIDTFFRSLAQDYGEAAIAVVLSGTGTDGSRGVLAVNDTGGLVIVQSIESAQFDGMPKTAIDTGCADFILTPAEMGETFQRYAMGRTLVSAGAIADDQIDPMLRVFDLLRERYALDFASYKTNTVSRRIQRRLQLMRDETLSSYVERLENDHGELESLYRDLLIGVTQFFRDPEAFEVLRKRVLSDVFSRHSEKEEIRVWVAACGTGEEAYSIAILLDEEAERRKWHGDIKVFATDVHRASIEFASVGAYSKDQVASLGEENLQKYFSAQGDHFQVAPRLRQMVVFASHNVLRDAPFTKLDVVTCRNMLIYLRPEAQKKVLSLFHFGLRAGGVLMLGNSESPGELSGEFEAVDSRWKFYRKRRDVSLLSDIRLTSPRVLNDQRSHSQTSVIRPKLAERQVLAAYEFLSRSKLSPSFVVNEQGLLIYVTPGGSVYLKPTEGFPQSNFFDLIDKELRTALAGLLPRAIREGKTVAFSGVSLNRPQGKQTVDVSVSPVQLPDLEEQVLIVSIDPVTELSSREEVNTIDAREFTSDRIAQLETELRYSRENLQATIQELETSNEELQASNEELVASNEELQSTNEELHSVNEELHTVNTEHQRKINELTKLTEDVENLLRSSDAVTLFLDEDLTIRRLAPGVEKIFQIVPSDIGRKLDAFNHSLKYPDLIEDIHRVIESSEIFEKEVSSEWGAHYLVRISPYRSRVGAKGAVLSLVDLHALSEAREELQASERLFRGMFENSAVGMARVGLDGSWLNVNDRLCEILGYLREDLLRRAFRDITHPDDLSSDSKDLNRLLCGEIDRYSMQKRFIRRDGRLVWANLTVSLQRDDHGEPLYCITVVQDITQRKLFEERLQQAVTQRDQFLATLSHELRNPLAALLHAARLLHRRRRGTRNDRPLDVIMRQSQQMSHLLDDLLDVSRITQNKFVLERRPVDLVQLTRDAAEALQPQIEAKRHSLKLRLPTESIWIHADATRILQIIENLLGNAARYTPAEGKIFIKLVRRGRQAILRVIDNGQGLSEEMKEKVFEMFVQSEACEKRPDGGMGLGLTLTKSIVELHGGEISVQSDGVGHGCTFEVLLPTTKRRPPTDPIKNEVGEQLKNVVLVEDEDDAREMLAETLRLDGFKVVTAANGDEGLAAILRERPDVALVDISLPGLSGHEIARQVRKTLDRDEVHLVAMTGFGRKEDRARTLNAGFDEHLVKPAKPADLQRVLSKRLTTSAD